MFRGNAYLCVAFMCTTIFQHRRKIPTSISNSNIDSKLNIETKTSTSTEKLQHRPKTSTSKLCTQNRPGIGPSLCMATNSGSRKLPIPRPASLRLTTRPGGSWSSVRSATEACCNNMHFEAFESMLMSAGRRGRRGGLGNMRRKRQNGPNGRS